MSVPLVVFLLVSLLIGLHASSRIGGKVRNFYVAGNIIPSWVISITLVGQAIDSGSSLGNASSAMSGGFWAGAVLPLGIGISLLLIGLFFAEPLHKMRILTLVDFYGRHYGRTVETLAAVLCLTSFIILLASNLAGVGIVMHYIVDIPVNRAIVIVAVLIMVYTVAGGLFAASWNDVMHVGIMVTGFGAALIWMLVATPVPAIAAAIDGGFSWAPLYSPADGALPTWATLIALGLGDVVAIDFMERVFAAKTPRHARVACLIAGSVVIAVGVAIAVIGIASPALGVVPEGPDAFLSFVDAKLPPGIKTMVFMALIAACVSTADGALMATSSVFTRNVIQSNFPSLLPQRRLLLFSRLCLVPVTAIACVLAIVRPDPGDLLVLAFEVVLAGCFVPLVLGIYWPRANARAAFWAIVVPSLLRVLLYFVMPAEWAGLDTLLPPLLSLIIFIFVGLSARPAHA